MAKMFKFLLLFALMSAAASAMVDFPRRAYSFESANGKYEMKYVSGEWAEKSTVFDYLATPRTVTERFKIEKWTMVEKKTRKELYSIEDENLSSKTVYISNDGVIVVAIDDFSERLPVKGLNVLAFYESGRPLKSYKLGNFIDNFESLQISVSHFRWCGHLPKQIPDADATLSIHTTDSAKYVFNFRTGEIVSKEKLPKQSGVPRER